MPEGPELFLSSKFVNDVCRGRVFSKIMKSEVSKCPGVQPPSECYRITSTSRGKELKVTLAENIGTNIDKEVMESQPKSLDILFTFGMSGKFDFYEATELQKHAHLNFFTCDSGPEMVLSFVDYRRFGKWIPGTDFSFKDRGPCVLLDYNSFRNNVMQQLDKTVFNKPICEALLDQKYFNGIGNYLRAEILYRAKIPPFVSARSVLEPLAENSESKVKLESPDILQLCHLLPQEVVNLENSWYDGKDKSDASNAFNTWLQCYYQDGMKNIADHNKRTIWYSGPLGPLTPKEIRVRGKKKTKPREKSSGSKERRQKSKTASKRPQLEDNKDADDKDSAPSDIKRTKLTKTVKAKFAKEADEAYKAADDKNSVTANTQEKQRKQVKNPARESDALDVKDLPEDLKDRLQTGRLTRGQIRKIVDVIEDVSEKKTKIKTKKEDIKKEKKGDMAEDKVKTEECDYEAENVLDGAPGMSARTKAKARSQKPVNNCSSNAQGKKNTQRTKLKTPRKRSIRRLSSS